MSIYDEQIRSRKASDQADFEDSLYGIAGAVMGKSVSDALNDDRVVTTDAIGDILKFYRLKPREVPPELRDMNEVLEYLLRPHGMMRRRVVLDEEWYLKATGAMLATRTDDGCVVALIPIGVGHYRFYDHKTGKMVMIDKRNRDLISRDAIMFYKPFPQKQMTVGSLIRYIVQQITVSDVVTVVLAVLAATSAGMMLPWINNRLFSDVLVTGSLRMLLGRGSFWSAPH